MTGWDAVGERWTVEHGDCLRLLALLEDASVDSVVTDPPYELGFMAKEWDSTGIAYRVNVWRECLRVLKPGGHLLAFGGSRTYHRMACAIEDAGFEIRDQIMWVYGSGFPKSLDVSKAIDKRGGYPHLARQIGDTLRLAREARGLTVGDCDRKFCGGTTNWSWFEGRPKGQRAPTPDTFAAIAAEWPEVAHCARLVDEAEREVVGKTEATYGYQRDGERWDKDHFITAPATDAAKQWQGWGTALKPAHEPIVLARKPLVGTVAANVLAHGTGAINIDATRVGRDDGDVSHAGHRTATFGHEQTVSGGNGSGGWSQNDAGRWPANFIHDGSDEVVGLFPDSKGGAYPSRRGNAVATSFASGQETEGGFRKMGDDGSAARFFYCAKASKADRNAGLEALPSVRASAMGYERGLGDAGERMFKDSNPQKQNLHPTVKPTDLMRYLCRLVTPPDGIVLDPFCGSGSTGKGAVLEGFRFIGIEQDEQYVEIARSRIADAAANPTLWEAS